ncbi:MAG: 23S rRNA (adenine(2503)-C(2))-methyltransferase RlmN [Chlamydiia bacterium]|nr:23S rRNA (adenine(2503)-C(2))-methyltransferase RlmN [Chlamydiia bacterium]
MPISIFSITQTAYARLIYEKLGRGYEHALKVYRDWFQLGQVSVAASWIEPQAKDLVTKILSITDFALPIKSKELQEEELIKFLLQFHDGLESESVLIPMRFGTTLCISSQIGCRMGCSFCQTGKMGLLRHLTPPEIVAQVFCAVHLYKMPVRNIVFMGMGEPLDNFDAVIQAVRILTCPGGFGMGPARITISTSGLVDGIYRLIDEADPALNLAVSVNAPNDMIRAKIMPVNKEWDMQALKRAMQAYCAHPRRQIFAEYVLLAGVNDSLECADQLAHYLEGLNVKVNLIPYNPQIRDRFAPPQEIVKQAFLSRMKEKGYQTMLRSTKGQKIMAACGQLGNQQQRKRLISIGSSN